jgi:putative nucleotidyltransferase with HDIG domain
MTAPSVVRPTGARTIAPSADAALQLAAAREHERTGCIAEALEAYQAAIDLAGRAGNAEIRAESLRRLAIVRHKRDECEAARELCVRSQAIAIAGGLEILAAEALNTLGVMLLREGSLGESVRRFHEALALGGKSEILVARIEQNLGIVANIRGDLDEALARYARSLAGYERANDEHGCALAYHNLGMVSADQEKLEDAERYFDRSYEIAERAGDVHLQGLCLLNHADVDIDRQRYDEARRKAEQALAIFDQIGAKGHKAAAYRVIGVVYRETGRLALAESRLRSAIEFATGAGALLHEAEATRDLALVYQAMGRNQDALQLLNRARSLFRQLDARRDLVNVGRRVQQLEETYLALIKEWGQSIESSDSYTFGHCGRVADMAVSVAEALGLSSTEITAIRLGAYLHDLGKVKVPHEVLNKPGALTAAEFEIVKQHPVWGIELLDGVEFPWDIKPIIRWHHEKVDGTGYPDQLKRDEVPLSAQVVGIVDVYDALTTSRAYRPALSHVVAMGEIAKMRTAWSTAVLDAFMRTMGRVAASRAA